MYVSRCMLVMEYVDKVNLYSKQRDGELQSQTTGTLKMTEDEEGENVHSSAAFPPVYSLRVCFQTRLCACAYVCVCYMKTAQWHVCEVTDSFIMACAHRETAPCRRRGQT